VPDSRDPHAATSRRWVRFPRSNPERRAARRRFDSRPLRSEVLPRLFSIPQTGLIPTSLSEAWSSYRLASPRRRVRLERSSRDVFELLRSQARSCRPSRSRAGRRGYSASSGKLQQILSSRICDALKFRGLSLESALTIPILLCRDSLTRSIESKLTWRGAPPECLTSFCSRDPLAFISSSCC